MVRHNEYFIKMRLHLQLNIIRMMFLLMRDNCKIINVRKNEVYVEIRLLALYQTVLKHPKY